MLRPTRLGHTHHQGSTCRTINGSVDSNNNNSNTKTEVITSKPPQIEATLPLDVHKKMTEHKDVDTTTEEIINDTTTGHKPETVRDDIMETLNADKAPETNDPGETTAAIVEVGTRVRTDNTEIAKRFNLIRGQAHQHSSLIVDQPRQ